MGHDDFPQKGQHKKPEITWDGKDYLNAAVFKSYKNDQGYSHEFRTRYLDIMDEAADNPREAKEKLGQLIEEIDAQIRSVEPPIIKILTDVSPLLNECTFLYFQIDRSIGTGGL